MRHHLYNIDFPFVEIPVSFNKYSDKDILQYCLGGTLYMPGIKDIKKKVIDKAFYEATSIVMCLEDAIREDDLSIAEENVFAHLDLFSSKLEDGSLGIDDLPLIFIRVRNLDQFKIFVSKLTSKQAHALSGFVFPKFSSNNALDFLSILEATSVRIGEMLYAMPILEGQEVAFREYRERELLLLRTIIEPYQSKILNIRIGGTDMSSLFGVRRDINSSIYDIMTVRDAFSDILNFFSRNLDYVVSAAVWEYFLAYKEDDINDVIKNNFYHSLLGGKSVINEAIDGLLREIVLDKANGFVGKTIIHPSHARFVNAMQVVVEEEYHDALQVLNTSGGVIKSASGNKMNEINPHRNWAIKTIGRAKAYGVVKSENDILDLILGKKS